MQALGTGMGTISNNLANVETNGYKTMRTNYQDLISECYFSSGHHNQVGRGSRVQSIQSMFTQGSFKNTGGDTDLAIAGDGFFSVRHRTSDNTTDEILYTRAGAYTFDKEGFLQDQSGNTLQGWKMSVPAAAGGTPTRMGDPVDIQVNQLTVPPVATTSIKLAVNLNAGDKSEYYYPPTLGAEGWEGNGFAGAWNAKNTPPISSDSYSHSEDLIVYDEAGNKHNLMVYYQKNPHMENVWDYIVTGDPDEDARSAAGGTLADSSFAGLIQKGKITFTGDDETAGHGGLIKSLEAQNLNLGGLRPAWNDAPVPSGGAGSAMSTATIGGQYTGLPQSSGGQYTAAERTYTITWGYKDPNTGVWSENLNTTPPVSGMTWEDDQGNYGYIPVSDKRYPGPYAFGSGLTVSFGDNGGMPQGFGAAGADSITVTAHSEQPSWTEVTPTAEGDMAFDLTFMNPPEGTEPPYPADTPTVSQTVNLNMGKIFDPATDTGDDIFTTTQYGAKSSVTLKTQNGYPEDSLERVSVTTDGKVMGIYGHNREVELYQISITRFISPWGLDKRGDNLFAATRYSGEARTLTAGQDGAGEIVGNFLEQSNVDTATEIVQMILTQRGFQANSKAVTTNDTVIATAIQTKR
jgi:flagellar hook-basal body protein